MVSEEAKRALVRREQVGGLAFGALATLLFIPLELLLIGPLPAALLLRVVWAVVLVASAALAARQSPRWLSRIVFLNALIAPAAFSAIIAETGGLSSPYLVWMFGFVVWMVPYSRRATLGGGAVAVLGIAWLLTRFPRPGGEAALTMLSAVMTSGLSFYTAWVFHSLRSREALAAAQLAESEARRANAERLITAGQLAAGVAHEINNPLGFVRSNLQFLASGEVSPEEREEVLQESLAGVDRIARIVRDLRLFTRTDSVTLENAEVGAVVDDAVRLIQPKARARDVQLEVEVPPGLPRVDWPVAQVVQVLVNLIANAVEAFPDPARGPRRVRIQAERGEKTVRVRVSDNGPGIPEALRPRLFEPFFTTKSVGEGTGLGLALAREHMMQAGGTLRFLEAEGGGAAFELELAFTAAATSPPLPSEGEAPGRTARYVG